MSLFTCGVCFSSFHDQPSARACCSELPFDAEGPAVDASELLGRAAALMYERGKTYDEPEGERSMGKTVAAFNAITGRDLTESEGWLLMCVLKSVRAATRKEPHRDSLEDLIAYAALMAEARLAGR